MRLCPWILSCLLIVLVLNTATGYGLALELNAKAFYLMDPYSGRVFMAENEEEQLPIASISKLMTLVLVLEALERGEVSLSDRVSTSPFAASKRGTRIWLEAGEQLTLEELLYAIAVGSANDAAVAVAEFIAGSEDNFVTLMNRRAEELGLTATCFINSTGLPAEEGQPNVMSAKDVAVLAKYAMTVPRLMDYVSTYEYTMRSGTTKIPVLWNANKLLRRYYGVDGLKTGFTTEAGYCIVVSAERESLRLIAVSLGHKEEAAREQGSRALLDYGFRKYQSLILYPQKTVISTLSHPIGVPQVVDVVVPADFYVTVERGRELDLTTVIQLNQDLALPIAEGTVVGTITAVYQDESVGTSVLTVKESVQKVKWPALVFRFTQVLARAVF